MGVVKTWEEKQHENEQTDKPCPIPSSLQHIKKKTADPQNRYSGTFEKSLHGPP